MPHTVRLLDMHMTPHLRSQHVAQRGVTLIELLVGITIGLLTIAVAMGALMVSRGVSGTVSDASEIQQQASYAFRVMGQQLRQAGSIRLKLSSSDNDPPLPADPVAFEAMVPGAVPATGFNPATDAVKGVDATNANEFTVAFQSYAEPSYLDASSPQQYFVRNCLGGGTTGTPPPVALESRFVLFVNASDPSQRELRCVGNGDVQPIVRNVANFQVRYLLQGAAGTGSPTLRYASAAALGAPGAAAWSQVFAVEVCLVLYGNEAIDLPAGTTYTDCDGLTAVNITSLASPRNRRMHTVFRSVYQLRSQGLTG
jgi:type IV pilus assembly protein PilW